MNRALLCIALAVCTGACKSTEPGQAVARATPTQEAEQTPQIPEAGESDAGKQPSVSEAAVVVRAFSEKLLKNELAGAREELRVPPEFSETQVDYFLQELQSPRNMTHEGVANILESDFGPLADRFGDQAAHVASKLGLGLGTLYAFGDTSAAAIVHWDGRQFRVAAVHQPSAP